MGSGFFPGAVVSGEGVYSDNYFSRRVASAENVTKVFRVRMPLFSEFWTIYPP
jgi:hypothetical protein